MVVATYKTYFKEVNIKNRFFNYYYDCLMKAKKVEAKNILIDERN